MADKVTYKNWRVGPYALLRWCRGKRFRTLRPLSNFLVEVPAGTLCEMTTAYRWSYGISIKCDPCPHCGVKAHISRISWTDIEPVTES